MKEHLLNIDEFAKSFFKDDALCFDPSAVTARSGPSYALFVIDNISGVDAKVLDTIDESESCSFLHDENDLHCFKIPSVMIV